MIKLRKVIRNEGDGADFSFIHPVECWMMVLVLFHKQGTAVHMAVACGGVCIFGSPHYHVNLQLALMRILQIWPLYWVLLLAFIIHGVSCSLRSPLCTQLGRTSM